MQKRTGRPTNREQALDLHKQFESEMAMFNPDTLEAMARLSLPDMRDFIDGSYEEDDPEGKLLHLCALRTKAAKSPADFAEIASGGAFKRPAHVELLNDVFVRASYEPMRVIISLSVRSGKSHFTSEYAPAWYMSKFPENEILQISHTRSLAVNFSAKVRDIIDAASPALFGRQLDSAKRSKESFGLANHTGAVFAAGLNGPLIGRGGHMVVIDDIAKSMADALSPTYNREVREWYRGTLRSRLNPEASIFVVLARWAETDFAGWLVEEAQKTAGSDPWVEIKIPQVADSEDDPLGREVGEVLWPERFDQKAIDEIRTSVGPITWAAQFQQNPTSVSNTHFPLSAWQQVLDIDYKGEIEHVVRFWDLSSGGKHSDYVVGALLGSDSQGRIIVLDIAREKFIGDNASSEIHEYVKDIIAGDRMKYPRCKFFFEETPGAGKEVAQFYLREVFKGYEAEAIKRHSSDGDKVTNAIPFSSVQQSGRIFLPQIVTNYDRNAGADGEGTHEYEPPLWVQDFIEELHVFPDSRVNDDQVDAASGAFNQLSALMQESVYSPLQISGPAPSIDGPMISGAADGLLERSSLAKQLGIPERKAGGGVKIYRPGGSGSPYNTSIG